MQAMRVRVLAVLAALCALAGEASAQRKHVLRLSDSATSRGVIDITDAFQSRMRDDGVDFELYTEALDVNRFDDPQHRDRFGAYLREKYAEEALNVIVALGPASLGFLTERTADLFSDVPIVYAGVRSSSVPSPDRRPRMTGVVSRFEIIETLELALALQPDARQIVVVTGTAPLDVGWHALAQDRLAAYQDQFEITYLAGLAKQPLLERLSNLPRETVVLFLSMRRDGDGVYLMEVPGRIAQEISAASSAPVYGPYEAYVGEGIVGGHVESFVSIGDAVAAATKRVLSGESTAEVPVVHTEGSYIADWRALQRWNLEEERLPAGTQVRFRAPSLWTQYRTEVLAALAIVSLQALLIATLLLHIRKRRIERRLHETEDRYRNVVEAQTDLICRYLPDGTLTFVNDAYCRYLGRQRDELVGRPFVDFLRAPEREKALTYIRSLVSDPRSESHVDQQERPDGSSCWHRWIDHPIKHVAGHVVEIQSIGHDITDLKLAEQEARQQREQVTHLTRVSVLGELSGALAHELHQPITAVLNNAQVAEDLLSRQPIDVAELKEILKDIVFEETRAGEVISRLRSMLKPGAGVVEKLDADAVASGVAKLVRTQLSERDVLLTHRSSPGLPPIVGDRVQLQQVLLNLLVNACDAMNGNAPADRVLITAVERDGEFVRFSVTDNGAGLAPHVVDRLFEPFVTTKPDGLGLGLSICRSIVRAHGGRLTARNNAQRGATVEFTVPIAK